MLKGVLLNCEKFYPGGPLVKWAFFASTKSWSWNPVPARAGRFDKSLRNSMAFFYGRWSDERTFKSS